eukprot:COSAG02_NODE_19497_length_879_cov_0.765385_1_plen_28_part_01
MHPGTLHPVAAFLLKKMMKKALAESAGA